MFVKYTNEFGKGQTLRVMDAQAKDEKTKERISALAPIIAIAVILLFTLIAESIIAHAEETNAPMYPYAYTYSYYTGHNDDDNVYEINGNFTSSHPAVLIATTDNEKQCTDFALTYYLAEYDAFGNSGVVCTGSRTSKVYYYNDVLIRESASDIKSPMDISFYDIYADGTWSTTIPVFATTEDALLYFQTGDTTGQLNAPQIGNDESLALLGFECDNSIRATWTGLSCGDNVNLGDVVVNVVPSCFLILESGETEQSFALPETQIIPYTDFVFEKAYSDYLVDNPYEGRLQLILTFIPSYIDQETNTRYNGQKIVVSFDENGKIKDMDLPSGSIDQGFSTDFYLKNFRATSEFHNWGDSFIHCLWTGSSIDGVVDYSYSEIKVDLLAIDATKEEYSLKWIEYDMDDIVSIRSNRLDFNLTELDEYCKTLNCRFYDDYSDGGTAFNWDNLAIRITPYYKTSNTYVNGRSVKVSLSNLAGIKDLEQSTGDATNDQITDWEDIGDNGINGSSPLDGLLEDVFGDNGEDIDGDGIADGGYSLSDLPLDFLGMLKGFISACGMFPSLIASVFSFLPSAFTSMLVVGLGLIILLRILGR